MDEEEIRNRIAELKNRLSAAQSEAEARYISAFIVELEDELKKKATNP